MKELSIEQKAEAYDESVNKLRHFMEQGIDPLITMADVQDFFPELKESMDEKIRKVLIELVKCNERCGYFMINNITTSSMLAWLEKQGESKSYSWKPTKEQYEALDYAYNSCSDTERGNYYEGVLKTLIENLHRLEKQDEQKQDPCEHCKDICLNCHNFPCIEKRTFNQRKSALEAIKEEKVDNQNCIKPADELGQKFKVGDIVQYITDSTDRRKIEEIDTLCNMYYTDSSPIMFEVEDAWKVVVNAEDVEQEHTDKVEPKFHINDWIVHTGTENIYQIVAIIDDKYQLKYGDNYVIEKCTDVDRCSRLWTIQDAKDGDIIVCPKYAGDIIPNIFIFKGITTKDNDVYCHCSFSKAFIGTECYIANADSINTDFYPATKEQRNTLFKAMTDAGYTFDFEKKVIKKRS